MRAFMASFGAAAAMAAGSAIIQSPATAQTGQSGTMEVIVYGNDPCPRSAEGEIVVCSRRPEAERYRIPEAYRGTGPRQLGQSWATRARTLETVSDTGTFSCSAVGPAGHTGCLEELIRRNRGESREAIDAGVPPQ